MLRYGVVNKNTKVSLITFDDFESANQFLNWANINYNNEYELSTFSFDIDDSHMEKEIY